MTIEKLFPYYLDRDGTGDPIDFTVTDMSVKFAMENAAVFDWGGAAANLLSAAGQETYFEAANEVWKQAKAMHPKRPRSLYQPAVAALFACAYMGEVTP